MKLAGLAIGILLAAGQVWAADLNATLKKAKAKVNAAGAAICD